MKTLLRRVFLVTFLGGATVALAHHSFAVFFDPERIISVTGKVTEFQFRNPHGEIGLEVQTKDGRTETWLVETNAPSFLRRRGWTRDSVKIGETLTIEGWAARDGKHYMRLRKATRADGTVIGVPLDANFDPEKED